MKLFACIVCTYNEVLVKKTVPLFVFNVRFLFQILENCEFKDTLQKTDGKFAFEKQQHKFDC